MANIITGIQILCSISLLAVSTFSKLFYILYLISGVFDVIDGTVARKTGTAIDFGSKFDSIADCNYSPQKMDITHCLMKFKCDRILSGGKNDRFRNN